MKLCLQILILMSLGLLGLSGCERLGEAEEPKIRKACNKADKKLAINAQNKKFPKIMDTCASDAWAEAKKTTACLKKKYPDLSENCSKCFGQMAECSKSHCMFKCIGDHFSDKCLTCVDKSSCREELVECTGIKENKLPPKK